MTNKIKHVYLRIMMFALLFGLIMTSLVETTIAINHIDHVATNICNAVHYRTNESRYQTSRYVNRLKESLAKAPAVPKSVKAIIRSRIYSLSIIDNSDEHALSYLPPHCITGVTK